jgi:hypothetical protein
MYLECDCRVMFTSLRVQVVLVVLSILPLNVVCNMPILFSIELNECLFSGRCLQNRICYLHICSHENTL